MKNQNTRMETPSLIQYTQKQVLGQLNRLDEIVEGCSILNAENDLKLNKQIQEWQGMIDDERSKVQTGQLTLAFVGTMKAGKSMALNAIIGSKLLPSRDTPMTTLPTIITHRPNHPSSLRIAKPEIFNKALLATRQRLSELGDSYRKLLTDDLKETIQWILAEEELKSHYEGAENIHTILTYLNDIIRICSILQLQRLNPLESISDLNDLPEISTEFVYLRDRNSVYGGRLSLIDSPGPNEAGQGNLRLAVYQILRRASSVVCILDYTQLKGEAEESIKLAVRDVQKLAKSRLFVLVNKFDQKMENGLSQDEAISYVSEHLFAIQEVDGESLSVDGKVYPISAKAGFLANMTSQSLAANNNMLPSPHEQGWVRDFAEMAYGQMAERMLQNLSDTLHKDLSQELWADKSRMDLPMQHVIENSLKEAIPLSLKTALVRMHSICLRMKESTSIIIKSFDAQIRDLQQILRNLQDRLKLIEQARQRIEKLKNQKLKQASQQIQWSMERWVNIETNAINQRYQTHEGFIEFLIHRTPVLKNLVAQSNRISAVFHEEHEAEIYVNTILEAYFTQCHLRLDKEVIAMSRIVESIQTDIQRAVNNEVVEIVKATESELEKIIDVRLKIPVPELPKIELSFDEITHHAVITSEEKYTVEEIELRRIWYTLWLLKREVKVKKVKYRDLYEVSDESISNALKNGVQISAQIATSQIDLYIKDTLENHIANFFNVVELRLNQVYQNIETGRQLHLKDQETKKRIIDQTNNFNSTIAPFEREVVDTSEGLHENFNFS